MISFYRTVLLQRRVTFRTLADSWRWSKLCSDEGLMLETFASQNSLRWLIYPYQLHVDNQLSDQKRLGTKEFRADTKLHTHQLCSFLLAFNSFSFLKFFLQLLHFSLSLNVKPWCKCMLHRVIHSLQLRMYLNLSITCRVANKSLGTVVRSTISSNPDLTTMVTL